MVRLFTPAILVAAGILLFPLAANAGQTQLVAEKKSHPNVSMSEKDNTKVLAAQGASVPPGTIPVVDDNGRLFFNRVVSAEELPKVDQNLKVLDTYTFEHNGRAYTNKIVADKA